MTNSFQKISSRVRNRCIWYIILYVIFFLEIICRRTSLLRVRAIDDQFGRRRPRRTETGALMDINSRDSDYHVHAAHTRAPLFANGSRLDAEAGGRYFNERVNRPQFLGFLDSTSLLVSAKRDFLFAFPFLKIPIRGPRIGIIEIESTIDQ